jgi:hypothetical protein
MKNKIAYAVFTTTENGSDYMVKGNFGDNKKTAQKWANENAINYPRSVWVDKIKY